MTPHRPLFWHIDSVWLFYLFAFVTVCLFVFGVGRHFRAWRAARGSSAISWSWRAIGNTLLEVALGRRIFTGDWGAGLMHSGILIGFAGLFVGTVLSAIDDYVVSFLTGTVYLVYSIALEIAGILFICGLLLALVRRYLTKVPRLERRPEDLLVLLWLLAAGLSGFLVEGVRLSLQQPEWGAWSFAGGLLGGIWSSSSNAEAIYPLLWWIHSMVCLGLVAAFPYTKLFHAIAGPVSIAAREDLRPCLDSETPEESEAEDDSALAISEKVLIFHDVISSDACIRCGRCSDACPSARAGEDFAPREYVISKKALGLRLPGPLGWLDARLRLGSEGRGEFDIEKVWHCTTCAACLEVCPLYVDTPRAMIDTRSHLVEKGTRVPPLLSDTLEKLQKYGNPWESSKKSRGKWISSLPLPDLTRGAEADLCYFVGCTTAIDTRAQVLSHSFAKILEQTQVSAGTLGKKEPCCGDIARSVGELGLLADQGDKCLGLFEKYEIRKVVTSSPHCFHTMRHEYPTLEAQAEAEARATEEAGTVAGSGGDAADERPSGNALSRRGSEARAGGAEASSREQSAAADESLEVPEIIHYSQLLSALVQEGKLQFRAAPTSGDSAPLTSDSSAAAPLKVTYHDPCYLGRYNKVYEAPRSVIRAIPGVELVEMEHHGSSSHCCGGGGGRMWQEEMKASASISETRVCEALETGAEVLITACPLCLIMLEDARKTAGLEARLRVADLSQFALEHCETNV